MGRVLRQQIAVRVLRATIILASIPLAIQFLFWRWQKDIGEVRLDGVANDGSANFEQIHTMPIEGTNENRTVWDILKSDSRISRYAEVVGMWDDIVAGLEIPQAKFTILAPVNEAFERFDFPWNPPWFYWKFLAGYHMGPGAFSEEKLQSSRTVSSFINADIFFTYKQRISVQQEHDGFKFNHHVKSVAMDQGNAVNGFVHHIDGLLTLPDSTADVLRNWPEFSTLRNGLIDTDLAVTVNDTATHVGMTFFAPTNDAFEKLGRKVNRFLFSQWGRPYLRALLKAHIVANHTLFTDVYFPHGGKPGKPLVQLDHGSNVLLPSLLPLLEHNTTIEKKDHRLSIHLRDDMSITTPDIVVMDGVVHAIDTVLVPPATTSEVQNGSGNGLWQQLQSWVTAKPGSFSVEELMERLQPYMTDRSA